MRHFALPLALATLLASTLFLRDQLAFGQQLDAEMAPMLPELSTAADDWLNAAPITVASLAGKVTLVHIWAFECWNCYRSFPWLNTLADEIDDSRFNLIGVHTPEFEREKDRDAIIERMARFELAHPVMLDNRWTYWNALGNRFWPAWYLVDGNGRIRSVFVGETHAGDAQARSIAREIRALLAG